MSRTEKVWKSGLTVDKRRDMIIAALKMVIGCMEARDLVRT